MQRRAGLAQREVERGRLEGPAPIAARDLGARRFGEQVERADVLAERRQRPLAGQRLDGPRRLQRVVLLHGVDDVLAETLVGAAAQVDRRRRADERAEVGAPVLERVVLDGEREA